MANFGDLLGSFIQSNLGQTGQARFGNALQDLQGSLGQLMAAQGGAGGMLDQIMGMAKGTLGNAAQNPVQAGGLGAVLGSVLGGGGDSIKGAMTGGVLAMLAGVAYKALTNAAQQQGGGAQQTPVSADQIPLGIRPAETPAEQAALESKSQLILKAMIASAKSDGQVSPDEVQRIVGKAGADGMGAEEQAWLMAELAAPLDVDALVAPITSQEVAAEVYAASVLAIQVDTQAERDYLQLLAQKTGLHPAVVQHIHSAMGVSG
jgi:uncharacterized membrane protein YebE (DUF533 family)